MATGAGSNQTVRILGEITKLLGWCRFSERTHPRAGPTTLDRRRVYILPTRAGFLFLLVLGAMLLGAINYSNSLGFALTFLLASLSVVSIIHTFRNLHGLSFHPGHSRPVFAGEQALFPIGIENRRDAPRFAVDLALTGAGRVTVDLEANALNWIELRVPAIRRGRLYLPRCTVETRFPLGLFRAWGYIQLNSECLIYPKPAEACSIPPKLGGSSGHGGDRGRGSDDFVGLRAYQAGDPLRHIHWKAVSRGHELVTKQFGGERAERIWLDWEETPGTNVETRLSHLCRWVLAAEVRGWVYGLALPRRRIPPDRGDGHRRHCLEALALFGEPS